MLDLSSTSCTSMHDTFQSNKRSMSCLWKITTSAGEYDLIKSFSWSGLIFTWFEVTLVTVESWHTQRGGMCIYWTSQY
jgi:hypothetical protein